MRKDVWKCIFTGLLCLWLFADIIDPGPSAVRIKERILGEQEYQPKKETPEKENFDWKKVRLYLKSDQQMDINIVWVVKGGILILFLSVIKRTH